MCKIGRDFWKKWYSVGERAGKWALTVIGRNVNCDNSVEGNL